MATARQCFEDCSNSDSCKQACIKEAREKFSGVRELTEQMVQVSKTELTQAASSQKL